MRGLSVQSHAEYSLEKALAKNILEKYGELMLVWNGVKLPSYD